MHALHQPQRNHKRRDFWLMLLAVTVIMILAVAAELIGYMPS